MDTSNYTVEINRIGKGSAVIQVVEKGANGLVIQRLKTVSPELRVMIEQALLANGFNPYQWQHKRWMVLSPLTANNVRASNVESDLKAIYAFYKQGGLEPTLPISVNRLAYYSPNQRAIILPDDSLSAETVAEFLPMMEDVIRELA